MSPAPEDITSGNVGKVWEKIYLLYDDVNQTKIDVAVIKENVKEIKDNIEELKQSGVKKRDNSSKMKATILGSIIMGISGVIVAIIALFKPS